MTEGDGWSVPADIIGKLIVIGVVLSMPIRAVAQNSRSCDEEIARFEAVVRQSAGRPDAGPTAPQSIGAQLGHQPTPSSVQRAETKAQSRFAELMARARKLSADGDDAGCMRALSDAKSMFYLR